MEKIIQFCKMMGLHPFVGFGMFAVDWMLFAGEGLSLGISWPISIGIAVALTIPCILIQKNGFKEDWGLAIGKGLMIGVLTAIPTALPSIATIAGGVLGTMALIGGSNSRKDETLEDSLKTSKNDNQDNVEGNILTTKHEDIQEIIE